MGLAALQDSNSTQGGQPPQKNPISVAKPFAKSEKKKLWKEFETAGCIYNITSTKMETKSTPPRKSLLLGLQQNQLILLDFLQTTLIPGSVFSLREGLACFPHSKPRLSTEEWFFVIS
ncbi:hypothetical protein FCM35_KLT20372 [Carex littledalei]|uniref:Uncharacterized protein n=1 Tax=Carex littledalei TaxID=544730 RepID=A0A833VPH4_9POAL|nr:hypothetical protein FCM35_KLT20372 [Carex littledalei]